MKIINSTTNYYLREVKDSASDAEKLKEIFADYMGHGINLRTAMDWCGNSQKTFNDTNIVRESIPAISDGIVFLCSDTDQELGAMVFSYQSGGSKSGFAVHKLSIKPEFRGQGHFSAFFPFIGWIANQFLQADVGQTYTIDIAPQVTKKIDERGVTKGQVIDNTEGYEPYNQAVSNIFDITQFRDSFTTEEWTPFSLSVNGVVVPTPTKSIPTRL